MRIAFPMKRNPLKEEKRCSRLSTPCFVKLKLSIQSLSMSSELIILVLNATQISEADSAFCSSKCTVTRIILR